jgi:acetyl esterase
MSRGRVLPRLFRSLSWSRRYQPSLESLDERDLLTTTPLLPLAGPTGTVLKSAANPAVAPGRVRQVTLTYSPGLTANVFFPPGFNPSVKQVPAIAFFHGGGLSYGSPSTWFSGARYFAKRGMVAVSFAYRMEGLTQAGDSVADARSALRWMRAFSFQLGIDPNAIVAAGDSAGGYLALMTALGQDQPGELYPGVPATPDAIVAFYPVLDGVGFGIPKALSPLALDQTAALPPTLIVQGTADRLPLTPYATAVNFSATASDTQLVALPGRDHAFLARPRDLQLGLLLMDQFLKQEHLGG